MLCLLTVTECIALLMVHKCMTNGVMMHGLWCALCRLFVLSPW